jgi:hypothetical protein
VAGVEPSPDAAARARSALASQGRSATIVTDVIEEAALPGTFDAIVFSYFTYSYIPGSAHRTAALARLIPALNRGGRVIISYLAASTPMSGRSAALARAAATLTGSDWRAEPHDVLLPMWKGRPLVQYEHRFTPGEIEAEARAAGFVVRYHRTLPDAPTLVLGRP